MMWPRLSKEFSKVAQLQAVSHSRGYAATGSGEILPPTRLEESYASFPAEASDLGAELVLI